MVTTPPWWGQQHQLDNSNVAIATRATTLSWQWQSHLHCKNTCALRTLTPSQQGQWHQLDSSKDACALIMATTLLLQGEQCQLDDYASSTTAEMTLQQGQQLPLRQQQRCLCINGNNAIASRATMPSHWRQGHLHIDDDNNTIATRATTPAWLRQHCYPNKGNNAIVDQGQWHHFTRAMSPTWQWQGCLCINNGNNAIIMRGTIAIATPAKTLRINSNNTIATWVTMPASQ